MKPFELQNLIHDSVFEAVKNQEPLNWDRIDEMYEEDRDSNLEEIKNQEKNNYYK